MKIKLSQYAKDNGITYRTAWTYWKEGLITGVQTSKGTILVDVTTDTLNKNTKRVVLYSRVSSSENKNNLESQLERVRGFAIAKGYTIVKEVKEVGSGLNDDRKQLSALLESKDYDILLVEHKDRLTRFGFNYIQLLLKQLGKQVEIINEVDSKSEDILQDLVSIITSFCARIYGNRRSKRKTEKIIAELNKDE